MARHPRIPLVFGGGMDRETGIMAAPPGGFEELVNVYAYEGKAVARRGMAQTALAVDDAGNPLSDITQIAALRSRGEGVVVGWRESDRTVHVNRTASNGTGPLHIQHEDQPEWFTLDPDAATPPKISAAESYDMMFLAHSEVSTFRRGPTCFYNPSLGQLQALTANLDGEGEAAIKFHGVVRHLNYLVGWGYGSPAESRPELVRVSLPGQPMVFRPEHYFIVGTRGDPVLACVPVGQILLAFKGAETWEIIGYDRSTFGVRPGDPLHGLLAPRLAVTVGDACYFWSASGPRVTTGGASVDLALPLDLGGPQPEDLVAEGAADDAFAVYLPAQRAVLFVFGRRVYALNIRNPQNPRWTYQSLGITPIGGGLLYPGAALPMEPPGYNNALSVTDVEPENVRLHWKNRAMVGDELIEVWLREGDGPWTQRPAVPVASGTDQDHLLGGLEPGTDYEWALRAVRGGVYRAGYEANDPETWPAESRGAFTTTLAAPTIGVATWERTAADSERIRLPITPAHANADIEIYRDDVLVGQIPAPGNTDPFDFDDDTANGLIGEELHTYVARSVVGAEVSPDSDAVSRWAGPLAPTDLDVVSPMAYVYVATWNDADPVALVRVEDTDVTDSQPVFTDRGTVANGVESHEQRVSGDLDDPINPVTVWVVVRIRHEIETFGVLDHSAWRERGVDVEIDESDLPE